MKFLLSPWTSSVIRNEFSVQGSLARTNVTFGTPYAGKIASFVGFTVHDSVLMIVKTVRYSIGIIVTVSQVHILNLLLRLPHS